MTEARAAREKIIVVGGYGAVGSLICRELGALYPGRVYAAGRSLGKAERFCRSTGGCVLPMELDIDAAASAGLLTDARLVVMCLDQRQTDLVRACLRNGVHYVDISANVSLLSQAEAYRDEAIASGATAILGVGLAPGVTNLLALEAHRRLERTHAIEIAIMLGLGDHHGRAAVEWTVDNLDTEFDVMQGGKRARVRSFTDGRTVDFRGKLGKRKAYRYPFSDQLSLPRTLGVPGVSTRLTFDVGAAAGLLAFTRRTGLQKLLNWKIFRNIAISAFSNIPLGSERFAVKVEAFGEIGGSEATAECLFYGRRQSEMTAKCALDAAVALCETEMPPGVYSIEERLEWSAMKRLGAYET
ncbi:saccharopine dehydrogenase family protein [Cohnella fermenti]|uniref:Saccharopine dehydrogenase n=1 Tax=Cohnella fermenti TaxID=2565925 RepID=A0A4S4BMR3_9BACL|nr:saccharopine dehydrogenase NADP-binding domain-containing protein [Cohnella fermenti]THF76045.1 saccharopine dehydrogenase [Cohnella fermenti]